jgi:methylated-DNA-[protein]-cysteine S-methyltransferase
MEHAIINAPFGQLALTADNDFLTEIKFLLEPCPLKQPSSPLLKETEAQLSDYFLNPLHHFDLPIKLSGTPFQQRVWQAIRQIQPGARVTYGALAQTLDTAPRAVGGACGRNPIPIIVPCHRVVSSSGLGGFMHTRFLGSLNIKSWLLAHEEPER